MKKVLSDLRDARIIILNAKVAINSLMDEPDADVETLNDALDELDKSYDALCEASEILDP